VAPTPDAPDPVVAGMDAPNPSPTTTEVAPIDNTRQERDARYVLDVPVVHHRHECHRDTGRDDLWRCAHPRAHHKGLLQLSVTFSESEGAIFHDQLSVVILYQKSAPRVGNWHIIRSIHKTTIFGATITAW
jgi:hypothetical protein